MKQIKRGFNYGFGGYFGFKAAKLFGGLVGSTIKWIFIILILVLIHYFG